MFEIPSRERLKALTAAAEAIAQTTAIGFSRRLEDGGVWIPYSYAWGLGAFLLPMDDMLDALRPTGEEVAHADHAVLQTTRTRAAEAFLHDVQTGRVVSFQLPGLEPPTRFWIALSSPDPLTSDQLRQFEAIASESAFVITQPLSPEERLLRLARLEQAAELIPALLHVLDVREVFDRLSATARRALPHDLLLLSLFSDDLSTFTVHARSDQSPGRGIVRQNPYPPSTIQAWAFSIVDDHTLHPFERGGPSAGSKVRSTLRFPIRFDNRVIAGVAFASYRPHAFSDADVPIGKRLSDHVASAISHFKLAERLAEQARQNEQLRARTTSLELLDELLAALTNEGGVDGAVSRISTIAQKVLAHDALALLVFLPDGRRARRYASAGESAATPLNVEIPTEFLDPAWEYELVDDVARTPGTQNALAASLGFVSALRVPIRQEGRNAAALILLSKGQAAFKHDDILVARRLADRLAVILARDRSIEAFKRADEATERAARLEARVRALTDELDARTGYRRVIGDSASWRRVLTQATQVAATATTALLLGESGTGKEVIARFVHRASRRSNGPFIALNCAALPDQLLEAELFGYERGAFTGAMQSKPGQLEQAAGGTLFLDEVGEMSLPAQAKFLRVLQEREFQRLGGTRVLRTDARIVAATNRDLRRAIASGQFREDLFYRLNVFAIELPPLRDRRDDILPLTQAFLTEFGRAFAHPPAGISREARQKLLDYHWPGNIRELRNILERAAILCDGGLITDAHLALPAATAPPAAAAAPLPPTPGPPAAAPLEVIDQPPPAAADVPRGDLQSMERAMIAQALQNARFNKSKAAKELGLTRHQLYIRMRRHGLTD